MKTLTYILSINLLVIFLSSPVEANIIHAASCSRTDVQSAINSAQDGDTVYVPAGECIWNSEVSIQNKTIILIGAGSGTGGTKIIYGGSNHSLLDINAKNKSGKMEVTGFWFFGGDSDYWSGTAIQFSGPKGWKNIRIHHNVFDNNKQWTMVGYANTHGLIDNNTFKGQAHGIVFWGNDVEDWETPLYLGTADFFFVEDNNFYWDDWYGVTGAACMDMNSGGRVVFRHNTIKYGFWETHDKARHGTAASANAYEIYNNSFWTNTTKWKGLDISAGTGVIWGNNFIGGGTWETDWTVPIGAVDYKSFDPRGLLPCDGNDPADQNVPGEAGWRCQYQIGTQGEGETAFSYPLYVWSNYNNTTLVGMVCTHGCEVNGRPHLLEGRDFINNGTTPKPGYTSFTYPHPLRQSGPTDFSEENLAINDFILHQNYPNPFNPTTTLSFVIGQAAFVSLKVFDVLGNEVATLVDEYKPAGKHEIIFDATNLSSSVYIYQLITGNYRQSRKMIILK